VKGNLVKRSLSGVALATLASGAYADELNMRAGVTDISQSVYDLHADPVRLLRHRRDRIRRHGLLAVRASQVSRRDGGNLPREHAARDRLDDRAHIIRQHGCPCDGTLVDMYDTGGEDMLIECAATSGQYKYFDENRNTRSFFSNPRPPGRGQQ
jgi:hypothetical protein